MCHRGSLKRLGDDLKNRALKTTDESTSYKVENEIIFPKCMMLKSFLLAYGFHASRIDNGGRTYYGGRKIFTSGEPSVRWIAI